MQQAPLQLERSFFTSLEVEADPQHKLGESRVNLTADPMIGVLDDDPGRWQIDLDIKVRPEPGATPPPYRIHLHVIGAFAFPGRDRTEEEKAGILAATGVSILYSQAREFLLMLTSRGPWGPFQLPTVSFVDTRLQHQESEETPVVREPAATYKVGARRSRAAVPSANADRPRKHPRRKSKEGL